MQWPYSKQPKTFASSTNELTEDDIAFHHSFKPRWGPMDSIISVRNDTRESLPDPDQPWEQGFLVPSEERDIVVLAFNKALEVRII
jgi:nuclear pore complex protein Nup98-Nup96